MVKYRYIPAYTRVLFFIPGISVLGVRHPADGYGAAAGPGCDESRQGALASRSVHVTPAAAPARVMGPQVAQLGVSVVGSLVAFLWISIFEY